MNNAAPQPKLDKLPVELLHHILRFLSDFGTKHRDFHNCEITCKALKAAVENDLVWMPFWCSPGCYIYDERITSHRFHSRLNWARRCVRRLQKSTISAIDAALSREEWGALLLSLVPECLPQQQLQDGEGVVHQLIIRVDASETIKALVDSHFHLKLQQALQIAVDTTSGSEYPIVRRMHIKLQHKLEESNRLQLLYASPSIHPEVDALFGTRLDDEDISEEMTRAAAVLNAEKRESIIRALCYRAGITVLSNDSYDIVWMFVVRYIMQLLKPAFLRLLSEFSPRLKLDTEHSLFSP